jgi:hypothetical protein
LPGEWFEPRQLPTLPVSSLVRKCLRDVIK